MKLLPIRCAGLLYVCISIITFVLSVSNVYASGGSDGKADTVHKGMSILFIGTINSDCYPDTVWAVRSGTIDEPNYLPRVIVWGNYDNTGLRGRKDSTVKCRGHIPEQSRVPYTLITYPDWKGLRGSFTPLKFNPEDTLTDLLFALHGTAGTGTNQHDSTRLLIVFGQSSLITLHSLALAEIGPVQSSPFVAMELRKGSDVVNEKQRDFSGRKSYEMHRVGFRDRDADTTLPHSLPAASVLHVYPNPTGIAAQVEGESIPAGEYSVEIVAVNGEVSQQQNVTVKEGGNLLGTLDVTSLPTGYYIVRLQQHGRLITTYPIVVTH